jgi:curved DNA-binding protein CbpA
MTRDLTSAPPDGGAASPGGAGAIARTHHDVLGVSPTATGDEIAAAEQALRGVLAGDQAALARLADARAVLDDPARRAAYDRELDTIARGYVDVADPLPLDRFARLAAVARGLGHAPAAPPRLDDWGRHDDELDGGGAG